MEHKFKCFLVSMRSQHDTIDFEADSIDEALKTATLKIGCLKEDWNLRFRLSGSADDAMEGMIATYRAYPWYLYIHEHHSPNVAKEDTDA